MPGAFVGGLLGEVVAGGSAGFAAKRFAIALSSPVVLGLSVSAGNTGASTGANEAKAVGVLAVNGEAVALNTGADSVGGVIAPNEEAEAADFAAKGEAGAGFEVAAANWEAGARWKAAAANEEAAVDGEVASKGKARARFEVAAANGELAGAGAAKANGEAWAGAKLA